MRVKIKENIPSLVNFLIDLLFIVANLVTKNLKFIFLVFNLRRNKGSGTKNLIIKAWVQVSSIIEPSLTRAHIIKEKYHSIQ